MQTPDHNEMDRALRSLSEAHKTKPARRGRLSADDCSFIERLVDRIDNGSKGVFIVINADNSLDYMIANESRLGAIAILARMIQRTARHVEEDGND